MPRIDPTRLLLCLRPLLNFQTGGIKSDKEVDKVFGLMSKFSKKLVSKCTYINILHATAPDILNLFMERGGWGMMYEWTVDAKQSKNNSLLNEILQLLLVTPATINRLKENSLPKEIKQISSRWECEESKAIAERIVAKWISIAKNETPPEHHQVQQATIGSSTIPSATAEGQEIQTTSASQSSNTNNNMSNLAVGFERDVTQNMDIDGNYDIALSDADLNDFNMVDFNPEFFSTIDQHLSELNNSTDSDNSFLSTNANHTILVQNPSETEPVVQSTSQNVPSIVIKSSGGQHSVVKPVNAVKVIQQPHEAAGGGAQGQEKICLVTHNGQRVILRVQVPNNNDTGTSNLKASVVIPVSATAQQDQQVTSSGPAVDGSSSTITEAAGVEKKRRRPRKDPTITNNNAVAKKKSVSDKKNDQTNNHKQTPKTYSKKASTESEMQPVGGDGGKGKTKDKPKSKKSVNSNSKTSSPLSSSSSSKRLSKSAAAAAAAAEVEKAERLRQQSKEAKKKMKERMELEKKKLEQDKQKQKDSKTLKEIYGLSAPQPVPKIPKKKPTFDEMIGVPGAKEAKKEKITREKQSESLDKSSKNKEKVPNSLSNSEKETAASSNEKDVNKMSGENVDVGFGLHARPESVERGPVKERPRHQVKVYTSSKSKNMDLLETMTKSKSKSNVNNDANKSENTNKISGGSFEDAINSSSVGASVKPGKRPSLDSTGKGGDIKKPRLDDSSTDKKDKGSGENGKDGIKKGSKDEKKDKSDNNKDGGSRGSSAAAAAAAKKLQGIQESSLFMDALTATRDTTSKSKRRRRISSSTDPKDIITVSSVGSSSSNGGGKDNLRSPKDDNQAQIAKPVFNFYRDTLNDDEDNESNVKTTAEGQQEDVIAIDSVSAEGMASDITTTLPSDTTMQVDDFAPAEGEGKLKSCLCIHRPKGKPKKAVKWREEDELKEYHFFEMDETERVNVSRPNKNFSEMKLLERNEEKLVLRRSTKMHNDSMEEQTQWRCPPRKLYIDPSTPSPKIESKEQIVQEERERSILQVFYFPGTQLPDHPSEVDVLDFEFDKTIQYRIIPGDDIPGQTKLYDLRKEPWPKPNGASGALPSIPNTSIPPMINPIATTSGFSNAFNPPQPTPTDAYDSFNPWSQSFAAASAAPVGNDPWKMPPEIPSGFSAFPPAVNLLPPPFGVPPPFGFTGPPPVGSIQAPPFGVPPPFGAPPQFDMPQNPNASREESSNSSRHSSSSRTRDVDYRSDLDRLRRNDNRSEKRQTDRSDRRDRDRGLDRRDRERSSYDSRGDRGGRDRGERHFDKDRDYRHSDRGSFRRPPNGRRNTLCNYFAKGFCREGHKCAFLHPGLNGPSTSTESSAPSSSSSSSRNNKSSSPSSPPQTTTSAVDSCDNDSNRNKSPPRTNNPEPPLNHSSPTSTVTISSNSSGGSESSAEIPPIASPTEHESFDLPPSSPSDGLYPPGTEPKVIPYTDEDWG